LAERDNYIPVDFLIFELIMFAVMKNASLRFVFIGLLLSIAACTNNANNSTDAAAYADPSLKDINAKISANPDKAELYYERGQKLRSIQSDSLAIADFKKAISLDSSKAEYFSAIGDILFEHKDISGSVVWIEKAMKRNPDDLKAQLKLAKLFVFIREYENAFKSINTVLRHDVYNAECYFLKGMIYKDLKDTSKAISSFQTAIQVKADYKDAFIQLGQLYSSKGDELALRYYDNAFREDTTDAFPLFARGVFYQDKNDYESAKAEYKNTILHQRSYLNAYINMGYILMAQDSLDKAMHQYDILVQIDQTNPEVYYNRGVCFEKMGKKDEAIKDYKQALVFDEKYPYALQALKKLGVR
jgi:tetratricopeptide (TPR) repeat protein